VGLPPGVINIVNGFGEIGGAALVPIPAWTKSRSPQRRVGKIIVKSAADTLKRVTLELGGKSPNIFFDGADWKRPLTARFSASHQSGRSLLRRQRIVKENLFEIRRSYGGKAKRNQSWALRWTRNKDGAAGEQGAIRPASSSYLEVGKKEAKVAKSRRAAEALSQGLTRRADHFLRRDNSARIAREEIFGPVASVIPFEGEPEAIASPMTRPMASRRRSGRATSTKRSAS